MIKIILLSLFIFYIITVIISYGLIFPEVEDVFKYKYTYKNKNYIGIGLEGKVFISSFLGPIIIFCFLHGVLKKDGSYHGFRYRRKYIKYYFRK